MATKTSAKSVWEVLSKIDVSSYIEKKNGLNYVSWTHAWAAVKQEFPTATFTKHTFVDNQHNVLPFMRDYKGNTFVKVSVKIDTVDIMEIYPVMDNKMTAINSEKTTRFNKEKVGRIPDATEINNAFQRGLTKCLAYHGLGINVYAGEDLPMGDMIDKIIDKDLEAVQAFKTALTDVKDKKELNEVWSLNTSKFNSMGSKAQEEVKELFKSSRTKLKIAS
mgnify:CR=1 FL=1|jgi:hypothetical protein|tara:strand:+ start:3187 stop:3846 length:660 start_codon:yes stop_codon:yes gene_type:complete